MSKSLEVAFALVFSDLVDRLGVLDITVYAPNWQVEWPDLSRWIKPFLMTFC